MSSADAAWDGTEPPLESRECLDIVSASMRRYYDLLPPNLQTQAKDEFNNALAAIKHLPIVNPPRTDPPLEPTDYRGAVERERIEKRNEELDAFERYVDSLQMSIVASEPDAIKSLDNMSQIIHFLMRTLGSEHVHVLAHMFLSCLFAKSLPEYVAVAKTIIADLERKGSGHTEH